MINKVSEDAAKTESSQTKRPVSDNGKRPNVTCPKFEAFPGTKRCRSYCDGGACSRDEFVMCVEWLKANEGLDPDQALARSGYLARDENAAQARFALGDDPSKPKAVKASQGPPTGDRGVTVGQRADPVPASGTPITELELEGMTDERLEALAASGYEFALESPDLGIVWLVPSYSPDPVERTELSFTDARTLVLLTRSLPGARIVSLVRHPEVTT
jgi:hypothetical protein